jgi:hypothetical protein
MDYNFRFFPAIANLGTFGNNWEESSFQTLKLHADVYPESRECKSQRGPDSSMSQLLLRDLGVPTAPEMVAGTAQTHPMPEGTMIRAQRSMAVSLN